MRACDFERRGILGQPRVCSNECTRRLPQHRLEFYDFSLSVQKSLRQTQKRQTSLLSSKCASSPLAETSFGPLLDEKEQTFNQTVYQ